MFLGMDIGSSFIKSAVLDLDAGSIISEESLPAPDFIDSSGPEREIPMEDLSSRVRSLMDSGISRFAVEGVVFAVQMHGFELYVPGGEALTGYVSWQDMRAFGCGCGAASRILNIAGEELLGRNGVLLNNSHSLCPLVQYTGEKKPPLPLAFAMIGDAVIRRLTGKLVPIHPTEAASTALCDLRVRDWNRDLMRVLSLDGIEFPPVAETRGPVAFYPSGDREIPLYMPVGDQQAAVLGCEAGDGDIVINIGTGGQICYIDRGLAFGKSYETRPFFSDRSIRTLADLPSGRNLAALMNFLSDAERKVFCSGAARAGDIWEKVNSLAEEASSAGTGLELDMSFFDGSGGAIRGINGTNLTAGNLFAAAYEAMAEAALVSFRKLELEEKSIRGIVGAGGILRRTPLLQRLIACRFGKPFRLSPNSEDVMSGLLRLGRWHAGLISGIL
jgi:sugar (pentulose or hexulose) kinase